MSIHRHTDSMSFCSGTWDAQYSFFQIHLFSVCDIAERICLHYKWTHWNHLACI